MIEWGPFNNTDGNVKLFFSRNPNPRLAVAVARHVKAAVAFEFASPFAPDQQEKFRALNPSLLLPILEDPTGSLWEADAIACRLSRDARSDFWRTGDDEPEMIRWISWGKENFVRACDMVHFERGTKQRYHFGPIDPQELAKGLELFAATAPILESALEGREWLLGESVSYADFRMASYLAFNDVAKLPLATYPSISRWYDQLDSMAAWRDPFAGLDAPPLPPVPDQA